MLRILTLVTGVLFNIAASQAAATKVEILTDDSYPPYSYAVNGNAEGIYPDIVRAIDLRLPQFEITIRPMPWKRGLKSIESGRSFALMPPYYRPERTFISPYSHPILDEDVVVYCNNKYLKNQKRTHWPKDFYGLTIGINSGFNIGGTEFWQAADEGKLVIDESKTNQLNVLKLRSQRIDCYVNDRISIKQEIKLLLAEGTLEKPLGFQLATYISKESGYMAYTNINEQNFPYKKEFVHAFDLVLEDLKQSGEIDKIIQSYTEE